MSNFKDLAVGTVLTAPSPATSGTTIVLASGHGARFPSVFPFPVTAAPSNALPSLSNSEFLMVTNRVSDTLTVVRAQSHGLTTSTAQSIAANWIISNAIYSDDLFTSSINAATVLTGTPNGSLTTFTLPTAPTMAWVFKNGVFMQPGAGNDYTLSGNTFTFSTPPATLSKLVAIPIVGNQVMISGSSAPITSQTPTGLVNGSNTLFTVPGGTYIGGTLEVKINGIDQKRTVHFTETSPGTGTFTMSDAPLTGDDIMVDFLVVNSVFGNAATVGGFAASATPTANTIPVLDASGLLPAVLPIKRQDNTTNTSTPGARFESGWGAMQFGSTTNQISEAVTFNTAFVGRPIVLISPGGDTGNVPIVYGDGDANVAAHQTAKAVAIRNTGFNAYVTNPAGNYSSGQIVYYQWIAIGV